MEVNYSGCALCDSTWGNFYKIVEGTQLFFCCDKCAEIYSKIVDRIKSEYDLLKIDYLMVEGNYQKRQFKAIANSREYSGVIVFSNGEILDFIVLREN